MKHRRSLRFALFGALASELAPLHAADVLVVDTYGAADYRTVQEAIDAAVDGDTILLRRAPIDAEVFGSFVIDGKGLSMIAQGEGAVRTTTVRVRNLDRGQQVVLSGIAFHATGLYYEESSGLVLEDVSGSVLVQDCDVRGFADFPKQLGPAACVAVSATDVVVTSSSFVGGIGGFGFRSGAGVDAHASRFAIHDSVVAGGPGHPFSFFLPSNIGDGGDGVSLSNSAVFAGGATLRGGMGGSNPVGANGEPVGGDGGTALVVPEGSLAQAVDVALEPGAGGTGTLADGESGDAVEGVLSEHPGPALRFVSASLGLAASALDLSITGKAGQEVELLVGSTIESQPLGAGRGVLHVAAPFQRVPLGAVPASGELAATLSLPAVAAGESVGLVLQAVVFDATAGFRLSNPRYVTVLDELSWPSGGERIHVDADAPPGGDGASWSTAYQDLRDALEAVPAGADASTEVWIAEGEYRPDAPGGDAARSFYAFPGTHLYGGFAGDETDLSQRDPSAHPVVLSGDLDGDDGPENTNRDDNAERVLRAGTALAPSRDVRIDGVRVRGGAVTGLSIRGDGQVVGCALYDNYGGLGFVGRRLALVNTVLAGNYEGAAHVNGLGQEGPRIEVTGSVFAGNRSGFGTAGLDVGSSSLSPPAKVAIRHCVFANNVSGFLAGPGALTVHAPATVSNSIFWGNCRNSLFCDGCDSQITCGEQTDAIFVGVLGSLRMDHCVVEGFDGSVPGTGNVNADPLFVDANGPDGTPGTLDDDLRLAPGSPAIDAGSNPLSAADSSDLDGDGDTLEPLPFDLAGNARFVDDPAAPDTGDGPPPLVDVGPLEHQP